MKVYRHPSSYRPPLAFGGHVFQLSGRYAQCQRCSVTVPQWAVRERLWLGFMDRWCPGAVKALDR